MTPVRRGAYHPAFATRAALPTPVLGVILPPTGMGCMTWLGTCGSGAGIGIRVPIMGVRLRTIREARHQAPPVCYAAAVGAPTRSTAGQRTATTTTRPQVQRRRVPVCAAPRSVTEAAAATIPATRLTHPAVTRLSQRLRRAQPGQCGRPRRAVSAWTKSPRPGPRSLGRGAGPEPPPRAGRIAPRPDRWP